jgi:hypothetical protein
MSPVRVLQVGTEETVSFKEKGALEHMRNVPHFS